MPVKASFGNASSPLHDKNYYTYRDSYDFSNKKNLALITGSFIGIAALSAFGISKAFKSVLNHTVSKKFAIIEGALISFIATGIGLNMLTKKRLKPISEEEQAIKEQKIKELVNDIAEKKDVKINGFCFYDYSKNTKCKNWLAHFDIQTGYVVLNSKFKDSNLNIDMVKPWIVHELTHVKQFENIARSKDGIYELNKIEALNDIKMMDEKTKQQILNTPDEKMVELAKDNIKNKPQDFTIVNEQLDIQNEAKNLKAIKMCLNNPNISKFDLPLMFDEKYYSELAQKGSLSAEEEQRVKTYFDYMSKNSYAKAKGKTIGESVSATINYKNDPMEKEAYAAQYKYVKTGEI